MKDYISIIKQPIEQQLQVFDTMFAEVLSHSDRQL